MSRVEARGGAFRFPTSRLAVSTAFFANGFVLGSWAPQVPVLAERLRISDSTLGLLILVFGLGAIVAMPIVGALIASGGSRRPTLATHALLAFALPLVVLAPDLWLVAGAIFFFGVALGGMDVAMNANAVSTEKSMARAIMSSCHGFWSLGGFAGAASGGWMIAAFGPLGHTLVVGAGVLAALVPVTRHLLDDRVATAGSRPARNDEAGGLSGIIAIARRDGRALGKGIAVGVFALFAMVPEGAAIDWSAIYLREDLGSDVASSGYAFAAFSATMAILRFAGDPIRDRFGAVRTLRISLVLGVVGLAVVGTASDVGTALLGFAILGVGLANVVPVAFSAAGNIEGLRPGVGISIATTLGYSGILVAPSVIGLAADRFGFAAVFLALSGLLVLVFLGSGLMHGADRRGD